MGLGGGGAVSAESHEWKTNNSPHNESLTTANMNSSKGTGEKLQGGQKQAVKQPEHCVIFFFSVGSAVCSDTFFSFWF